MKRLLLLFVALYLPMLTWADSPGNGAVNKSQRITFYSDRYAYQLDGFDEIRTAFFLLIENPIDSKLEVKVYENCIQGGTCEQTGLRSYCRVQDFNPFGTKTNKTFIFVDLQPEDCDESEDFTGVVFNAVYNGWVSERIEYGSLFWHLKDPQSQLNCIVQKKDGVLETRYADVEMLISGQQVFGGAYIKTETLGSIIETCPEE